MGYKELVLSYSNKMRVVEAPASGGGIRSHLSLSVPLILCYSIVVVVLLVVVWLRLLK